MEITTMTSETAGQPLKVDCGSEGKTREERSLTLLRSPDKADESWFMHVPVAFNNALDIVRTFRVGTANRVWTQGTNYAFGPGDTIYDTPLAGEVWAEALRHIQVCFQVTEASSARPPIRESTRNPSSPRYPGAVTFKIMVPNEGRTALTLLRTERVTQDDFVRILKDGFDVAGRNL